MNVGDELGRIGSAIATAARWVKRGAVLGALGGLAVGAACWLVVVLTDLADGPARWAALLVCLIPAAAFTVLWWLARTVSELARHLPADLGVAARRLQDTPGQLVGAARRVTDAKGLVNRSREIRSVIGDVKALNPEEETARDRLEKLYASFGTITPVALVAVASFTIAVFAIPLLVVIGLVT